MLIPVTDAELWIEEEGRGPAVLVPTGAGIEFYRRTFSPRLRASLRLIYVEMRETGRSTGQLDGNTFPAMADDLDAVRRALGLDRVAVLGHSNHASIALEFGLRHASATSAVVAVGGVPDFTRAFPIGMARWQREASAERLEILARRQAEFAATADDFEADERAVRQYVSIAPLAWRDPHLDPLPLWGEISRNVGAYLAWIAQSGTHWNLVPRLGEIRVPVLAVCGRWDYLCPFDLWSDVIDHLPDGRLEIFEDSAHNPQYEEAERFDRVVLEYVNSRS